MSDVVKYKVERYPERIREVLIDRETETSVWVDGCRRAKRAEYENFFDTWEEAHAYLIETATIRLESCRRAFERAQGEYDSVKGMVLPLPTQGETE